MLKYISKRLLDLIPTIFIVATIVFFITRILPGDPASSMLGPQASAEDIFKLRQEMGLNDPLYVQYFKYLGDLLRFDLGKSFYHNRAVLTIILERFPNTVVLAMVALVISLLVGVPMGIIAASKKGSILDMCFTSLSLFGVSLPVFWLGIMLSLLFGVHLQWLPVTGIGNMSKGFFNYCRYLILPGITLATIPMANFARIIRSSLLDTLDQNYIKTARSKGVSRFLLINKHALKNALTPLITVIGMQVSSLLSGAVLTETIFSWPGMGRLIVDSIEKGDFMTIQGTVLFTAILYVVINIFIDLLYKVVNPKVKIDESSVIG